MKNNKNKLFNELYKRERHVLGQIDLMIKFDSTDAALNKIAIRYQLIMMSKLVNIQRTKSLLLRDIQL
jgi:hypothetical protein